MTRSTLIGSFLFAVLPFAAASELAAEESDSAKKTRIVDAATAEEVETYFERQQKQVVTFYGYSGAAYERPDEMLKHAEAVLKEFDPAKTIVNCGATSAGIGSVYRLAKSKGFPTTGIVSTLAKEYEDPLSPFVDVVFFVKDEVWGGLIAETGNLSPTSQAMVNCSDVLVGIGGGAVSRDELLAGKKLGKEVRFIPADMNHQRAIEKAREKKRPEPTDFRGEAHRALVP